MASYVLAFTGGSMPQTKEAQEASMAAWGAWFGTLGDAVANQGNPFGPSASIAPDGSVSDGGTSRLSGYTVLTADSLDAATAMAKGCPQLSDRGAVEVYETVEIM